MRTKMSALALVLLAGVANAQVQHGTVNVVEIDGLDTPASINATRSGGFGAWSIDATNSNRGDIVFNFGFADDTAAGVLISSPFQIERFEPSIAGGGVAYLASAASYRSVAAPGRWATGTWAHRSGGPEVNLNTSNAFFPIADGWVTANFVNDANSGQLTTVVGNPSIVIRNETTFSNTGIELLDFTPPPAPTTDPLPGWYLLSYEGVDFNRDGVLITTGGKDENNRGAFAIDGVSGIAYLWCQDVQQNGGAGENDPVSFVFIPAGTAGVTMGTVSGSAGKFFSQGDWQMVQVGQPATNGTFRLTIAGQSPATGTLLVSHALTVTRSGNTPDNPVHVAPDGDGWLLTSRDQPNMGLQDNDSYELNFSFAFFPNGVAVVPPAQIDRPYLDRLDDIVSARFQITEIGSGNTNGEVEGGRVSGSDALELAGLNRGDFGVAYLGKPMSSWFDNALDNDEALILGTPTEFRRDNTNTGGVSGWTTVSFDNANAPLHNASVTGGEINANFALAAFPPSAGLQQAGDIASPTGVLNVPITGGGNATNDGVMMATNWDNNNRSVGVAPDASGAGYDLTTYEANTATLGIGSIATDSVEVGYVYLPYNLPNLIAGQVAADGTIISGTGGFTVEAAIEPTLGFEIFKLTIDGVNAQTDGMLLLNSRGTAHAMAFEAGPSGEFEIAGFDLLTQLEGRCAFNFAYIPAEGLGAGGVNTCPADLNGDTFVDDTDFVTFAAAYEQFVCLSGPGCEGDFNNDGFVDDSDFVVFAAAYEAFVCP